MSLGFSRYRSAEKLYFTVLVSRSFIQIHNLPIVQVRRIHSEVDAPNDLFVDASVSKWLPFLYVSARCDLHRTTRACANDKKMARNNRNPMTRARKRI